MGSRICKSRGSGPPPCPQTTVLASLAASLLCSLVACLVTVAHPAPHPWGPRWPCPGPAGDRAWRRGRRRLCPRCPLSKTRTVQRTVPWGAGPLSWRAQCSRQRAAGARGHAGTPVLSRESVGGKLGGAWRARAPKELRRVPKSSCGDLSLPPAPLRGGSSSLEQSPSQASHPRPAH